MHISCLYPPILFCHFQDVVEESPIQDDTPFCNLSPIAFSFSSSLAFTFNSTSDFSTTASLRNSDSQESEVELNVNVKGDGHENARGKGSKKVCRRGLATLSPHLESGKRKNRGMHARYTHSIVHVTVM